MTRRRQKELSEEELGSLQMLVAGALYGCLMKQESLTIEAEILVDAKGNLRPEIAVRGLQSEERLLIRVERVEEEERETIDEAVARDAPVPPRMRLRSPKEER